MAGGFHGRSESKKSRKVRNDYVNSMAVDARRTTNLTTTGMMTTIMTIRPRSGWVAADRDFEHRNKGPKSLGSRKIGDYRTTENPYSSAFMRFFVRGAFVSTTRELRLRNRRQLISFSL